MDSSVIKIDPKKLWKALCEAAVVHFAGEKALRFVFKDYPTEEEDGYVVSVSLFDPGTKYNLIMMSEEEITSCEAEWDCEDEDITITRMAGSECHLEPFRLYKEFCPDLNDE